MFNLHKRSKLENLKTLEMWETFGLEEKIHRSFVRHYKEFMRNQSYSIQKAEDEFQKHKSIYIGSSLLGNSIKPIEEKYGQPKLAFPKTIKFFLMNKSHPSAGTANAFFMYYKDDFIVGKIVDSIFNFNATKEFNYSIQHEIQHFLMSIYGEDTAPKYIRNKSKMDIQNYYGDDWEIQSNSTTIAKKAIDMIEEIYEFRVRKAKTPQDSLGILNKIEENRSNFITNYINAELNTFFKMKEEARKESFTDDIKKKYYLATVNNFKKLFDRWLSSKRA